MLNTGLNPPKQGEPLCTRCIGADPLPIVHPKDAGSPARTPERPPLFSGILPGDYSRITALARNKEFTRGEMLYVEGDPVQRVLLLTSGFAKITKFGLSGIEVILRLSAPGDVLGAQSLFCTGRSCTTVQAFRDCRALVWEASTFRSLVERYSVLHKNILRILSHDMLELQERFREMATEKVGTRVAHQIVRLEEKIGRPVNGSDEVEISLSREELAQMTGTTLFTVSRLLSTWEALGMVKPRREAVTICDLESLRAVTASVLFSTDICRSGKAIPR
jgi:CRP/FNR family transcriptional regulator, nitrogen oxide reductase regulator